MNLFSFVVLPSGSWGPLVFYRLHLCSYQIQVLHLGEDGFTEVCWECVLGTEALDAQKLAPCQF